MSRLALIVVSLSMFGATHLSLAQTGAAAQYPDRPVRIVVAFAPGGIADITVRLVADKLTGILGKQVVVENIPGAGGIAAAQAVMRAKPDGHSLLLITNGTAISKSLFKALPFDPVKDFVPVSFLAHFDIVILTKGDARYRDLGELLASARAQPGKFNFGTINPGSTQNLSAELFRSTAGIGATIVPFRTSPEASTALMSGEIDVTFEAYAAVRALVESGKLKALASTGSKRSEYLPNVPTTKEAGLSSYEVIAWNAISAPAGTPPDVIALLNRHLNSITAMPDIKKRFLEFGTEAYAGTSEEVQTRLANDIAKWGAVIKQANIPQQ
jgi:tripartite-type tricarboxylate transporter receptor subunit TctC